MNTQAAHDQLDRTPFWTVQTVFDPDGGGKDFAYTIGLHDRGHPELHIWARPDLGDDPGEDWMLSTRDRCHVLNELAWRLVDGHLEPGSTLRREYDDGAAVLDLVVDGPGDREVLEPFGIHPRARVLPVRWSLTRTPEGRLSRLTKSARETAHSRFREIAATIHPVRPTPRGWRLPASPSFAPGQKYGPLTPVVRARAAQLVQGDVTSWNVLLWAALLVDHAGSLTWPVSMAKAAARPVGRRTALEQLEADVEGLVDSLTTEGRYRHWFDVLLSLNPSSDLAGEGLMRVERSHRSLLRDATLACLSVEAVADVIDRRWLLHARGPWVKAFDPGFPGSAWTAPAPVLDKLVGLLTPLDATSLGAIAKLHSFVWEGRVSEWSECAALAHRVTGWGFTGPHGCPWRGVLDQLPAWRALVSQQGLDPDDVEIAPLTELHDWASLMTSAICHRARLSAAEVRSLAEPYREVLPQLETVLNEPVVLN
jgi:hypothetical protein